MFGFIKKIFGAKPAEATQPEAAPYKVETVPVVTEVVEAPKVEEAPKKKPAPKKQQFAKKAQAPKPATAKPASAKKGPRKPKSKPAV